jgi:hypothetical protein
MCENEIGGQTYWQYVRFIANSFVPHAGGGCKSMIFFPCSHDLINNAE